MNKILCNFDQQLTELEKYTARGNLGVFTLYEIQSSSITHTVDQTEAQNGNFSFSRTGVSKVGLYLLSVQLYISPDGTKPNDSIVPIWLDITRHYSGGEQNTIDGYTADITRLEQNGPWLCRLDIFVLNTRSDLASLEFDINFEDWKIPQNTPVECRVTGILIGNIEPTP